MGESYLKIMKILNLYAGIGGNRKLWPEGDDITAVEIDPKIAAIYQKNFPNDTVVVTDAHQYLLDHYKEFDFIWSSPPCPSHSNTNRFLNAQGIIRYPDMVLYQEIIFLKEFFKGQWVVENVRSYYEPLIKPFEAGRHFFWSNFVIASIKYNDTVSVTNCRESTRRTSEDELGDLEKLHGFKVNGSGEFKRKVLCNCVKPQLGLHIFNCAFKIKQTTLKL
jgi:DNA (cytosine-5)-methyltransferase 1